MKIHPQDIGHFKSADQARCYQRATALMNDMKSLAQDVQAVDQKDQVDLNQDPGKVVLNRADLTGVSGRQSRTSIRPPGYKGPGTSTDPLYLVEKKASGEAEFGSQGLKKLRLDGDRFEYDFHQSHGFLGLGKARDVYELYTAGPHFTSTRDKVIYFPETGDVDFRFSVYGPPPR